MSRVFDALTRAGEEKNEHKNSLWVPDGEGHSPEKISFPSAVSTPAPAHNFPGLRPQQRSWRERLEELFFGWDLRKYKTHPLVALERESPAAEQYKILREHIKRVRVEAGARSIAVTSPVKGDGKTSVVANLATATALDSEQQVLIIDADLRSPELHRYFGIPASPGLADYLRSDSKEDLTKYIHNGFLPNLRIIPAGKQEALSSELLARSKTRELMEDIYSRFPNYQVMIDAPPILSTSDPLVLANTVDIIIMVARAGKTPRKFLFLAVESLNSDKLKGIVLSGIDLGFASNYYHYSMGRT